MKTYKKRISVNPDEYADIDIADIEFQNYIETSKNGSIVRREYWQQGAPVVAPPTHNPRVSSGQIIALLKDPSSPNKGSYAKIYRAAYPQGNKAEDDIPLEFLEQARMPYSDDGLIDVADIEPALDYFISQNYMGQSDKDGVMQGWPV